MGIPIHDRLNILKTISSVRLINLVKLQAGYMLTNLSGRLFLWGFPFSLSVEPTTSCNLRCPECPSGLRQFSRNTGMMDFESYRSVIDQTHKHLMYLLLYFQGEPYLNPSFFDFVKYAKKRNIYTATSTNAHFLTDDNARKTIESGLDRLIISLDGIGQEAYATYRVGGRYDRVIKGIENMVRWKKEMKSRTPHIIVQFIVFRSNEHQLDEVRHLCKKLGVDELQFKTAQINDYKNGNPLIPTLEKYSRYRKLPDGTWEFRNKLPNRCYRMWTGNVITWDGLVVPCCFDKDAEYRMGDLNTHDFRTIWKSDAYRQFRKTVFSRRRSVEICRNCTEGMKI